MPASIGVEGGLQNAQLVSGRYRIQDELGSGGMASVHRALDLQSGAHVALKRLKACKEADDRNRGIAHLEREYHTLSQLAHPRVVSVFDYGVDNNDPYYTMELLDGGDLQARSPLDWRTACSFARDVCSALSLLHSRRLVHRDLSPRNVRCTSDGRAKLIDFGAMVAMGPTKSVVGTPAICAPEVVRLQPLDGRADLYALGATLYFTLTGTFPYPARTFTHLESLWHNRPRPPSERVAGIPPALDALVMDLLQLDASLRPSSAAEVTQRLSGIAGLPIDEHLLVTQAYLATPNLVGRDAAVARVRKYAGGLLRGRGRSLLIDGQPGVGRTRFLDACSLEGKLVGALVVRADASDAIGSDFAVALALGRRLFEAAPEVAYEAARPYAKTLAAALPGLELPSAPQAAATDSGEPDLQAALLGWLSSVPAQRALMLVVDDLDRVDEGSAAVLALLAKEARHQPLLIVSSRATAAHPGSPALRMLAEASGKLALSRLSEAETETLLGSMFGRVPNLRLLVSRLYAISEGRPRDLMQLTQHLLDKNVVRYAGGAWSLPEHLDHTELPNSLAQALIERVWSLSPEARQLAQALALCPTQHLDIDECALLAENPNLSAVMRLLDELLITGVLAVVGERFALGPQGWSAALISTIDPLHERALHLRLAQLFEQRRNEEFLRALHLFHAGEDAQGLSVLIAHAEASQKETDRDPNAFIKMLNSVPNGWLGIYDHAIALCAQLDRPARERYLLMRRTLGLASYDPHCRVSRRHYLAPVAQLVHDCGLDLHPQLDPALPAGERLKQMLGLAKRRYEALPEQERVLDPISAAGELARMVLTCVGAASTSLDLELVERLPSLEPLLPLSPGIAVVHATMRGLVERLSGRNERAREMYIQLERQLHESEIAGLDETYRRTTLLAFNNALAQLEAAMGLASCLDRVQQLAGSTLHDINACNGHGLYHLFQCDPITFDRMRAQAELLMVQKRHRSAFEGVHLLREVVAHAGCDDITRLKQCTDSIETMAARYPDWQPVLHYARGEHARVRGDLGEALVEFERGLQLTAAGRHAMWAHLAGSHLQTLVALDRCEQARNAGEQQLALAQSSGLGFACSYLRMPLALACARLGEFERATEHAQTALQTFTGLGSQGLNLALAHETRARVAIFKGDAAATEWHLAAFAQELRRGSSHTLSARYERCRRTAHSTFNTDADAATEARALPIGTQILAALTGCACTQERAQRSLEILLAETGSSQGFLYALTTEGCTLAASNADHALPPEIDAVARRSLADELADDAATGEGDESTALGQDWTSVSGRIYRSVLLGHQGPDGFTITGLGVLLCDMNTSFRNAAEVATELSRHAALNYEPARLSVTP